MHATIPALRRQKARNHTNVRLPWSTKGVPDIEWDLPQTKQSKSTEQSLLQNPQCRKWRKIWMCEALSRKMVGAVMATARPRSNPSPRPGERREMGNLPGDPSVAVDSVCRCHPPWPSLLRCSLQTAHAEISQSCPLTRLSTTDSAPCLSLYQ